MAVNIEKIFLAGFKQAQWGYNTNGYMLGTTPLTTSDTDSTEGMKRLFHVLTADVSIPEAVTVTKRGDNNTQYMFMFPPGELPSFTLQAGSSDFDLGAKSQGTSIYALGDWDILALNPNDPFFGDFVLLLTSDASSAEQDSGCSGSAGYWHVLIPSAKLQYLGTDQLADSEDVNHNWSVTVNKASCFPWGLPMNSDNVGTTGAAMLVWFSENRVSMQAYIDDGMTGSFTLERTPAGDETTNKAFLYRDGVGETISSLSTSTRVLAFSTGASGDRLVVVYEYV